MRGRQAVAVLVGWTALVVCTGCGDDPPVTAPADARDMQTVVDFPPPVAPPFPWPAGREGTLRFGERNISLVDPQAAWEELRDEVDERGLQVSRHLRRAARNEDVLARVLAARGIGRLGRGRRSLRRLNRDESVLVRVAAADASVAQGRPDREIFEGARPWDGLQGDRARAWLAGQQRIRADTHPGSRPTSPDPVRTALETALGDPTPDVRSAALQNLIDELRDGEYSRPACEALVKVRAAGIETSGHGILAAAVARLDDDRPENRVGAIRLLTALGKDASPALDRLLAATNDPYGDVRTHAIVAYWRAGGNLEIALDRVRAEVTGNLEAGASPPHGTNPFRAFGNRTEPLIVDCERALSERLRGPLAAATLAAMGEPAVPVLRHTIEHADRATVAHVVARMRDDPTRWRACRPAVVRRSGVSGFGESELSFLRQDRPTDRGEARALAKAVTGEQQGSSRIGEALIESIGRGGVTHVDLLLGLRAHANRAGPRVRTALARAVAHAGPAAVQARGDLVNWAEQGDFQLRTESLRALGRIGASKPEVVELLVRAMDDGGRVAAAAAGALMRVAPSDDALALQIDALRHPVAEISRAVIDDLDGEKLPRETWLSIFHFALQSPDKRMQIRALEILGSRGVEMAPLRTRLRRLARLGPARVGIEAALALARIDPSSREFAETCLERIPDGSWNHSRGRRASDALAELRRTAR